MLRRAPAFVAIAWLLPALLLVLSGCVQTARSSTASPPPVVPVPAPAASSPVRPAPVVPRPPAATAAPGTAVPAPVPPAANAATGAPVRGASAAAALGAASVSLLDSSRRHVAAGELDAAAADLERALALESNQPRLWLELAEVRLRQGLREQARNLARRAQSLIGNDAVLAARAADLLRRAGG